MARTFMTTDISIIWPGSLASLLAGLATGIGALAVFFIKPLSDKLQDSMLAGAAGAMLFIISNELIPETHRNSYKTLATF